MKTKVTSFALAGVLVILLFLCYYGGLFTRYNYFTALADIHSSDIRIVQFDENPNHDAENIEAAKKINATYIPQKNMTGLSRRNGIYFYNKTVGSYLDKKVDMRWRESFRSYSDSLFLIHRAKIMETKLLSTPEMQRLAFMLDSAYSGRRKIKFIILPQRSREAYSHNAELVIADSCTRFIIEKYFFDPESLSADIIQY
jgi:hypothetical protein